MNELCAYEEFTSNGAGLRHCGKPAVAMARGKWLCPQHIRYAASLGLTIETDRPCADFSSRIAPEKLEEWLKKKQAKV